MIYLFLLNIDPVFSEALPVISNIMDVLLCRYEVAIGAAVCMSICSVLTS